MCGHQKSTRSLPLFLPTTSYYYQDNSLVEPRVYQLNSGLEDAEILIFTLPSTLPPFPRWNYRYLISCFAFYMGAGNLNSGICAYTKSPTSNKEFLSRVSAVLGLQHQAPLMLQYLSKPRRDKFKSANHWMRFCCCQGNLISNSYSVFFFFLRKVTSKVFLYKRFV